MCLCVYSNFIEFIYNLSYFLFSYLKDYKYFIETFKNNVSFIDRILNSLDFKTNLNNSVNFNRKIIILRNFKIKKHQRLVKIQQQQKLIYNEIQN